jgi:hypothetical protein
MDRIIKIRKLIRKISMRIGEGSTLIFARNNMEQKINYYITGMEIELPDWLRDLSLEDPLYILHAAFIMDGACLIKKSDTKITPRLTIYPAKKYSKTPYVKAWGLKNSIKRNGLKENNKKIISKMRGKGSRTHTLSNLTTLESLNPNINAPNVICISISADGPVKIWPLHLIQTETDN